MMQGRQRCVLAGINNGDPAESPHVSENKATPIIEQPRCPLIRIGFGITWIEPKLTRHSQMHDELAVVLEFEQQVLASPVDLDDRDVNEIGRLDELRRREGAARHDRPPNHLRAQLAAKGLDLG